MKFKTGDLVYCDPTGLSQEYIANTGCKLKFISQLSDGTVFAQSLKTGKRVYIAERRISHLRQDTDPITLNQRLANQQ